MRTRMKERPGRWYGKRAHYQALQWKQGKAPLEYLKRYLHYINKMKAVG